MATYDPKFIKQSFFGVEITGYASGTFLSVTSEDGFEKHRGSDGAIDFVNKNVNDLEITCTLKQTSEANLALSVIHEADKLLNTGVGAYMLDDLRGDTKIVAAIARVKKRPDMVFSDTIESREWIISTGAAVFVCGGSI